MFKGENTAPLDKIIPGQMPGFAGSPYYELSTIIEKWGPLCVVGNVSPYRLADYFQGLGNGTLVTRERQFAASTVAWPLLNALNNAEIRNNTLVNENELLKDHIEKSEQELGILTGKKPNSTSSNRSSL